MSDAIASKNLYEILGNDPELDPERATPPVPTKVIDKPVARTGKRNGPAEGNVAVRDEARQGGRGGATRGDGAGQNADGLRSDRHPRQDRNYERRGGEGRGRGDRRGRGDGYRGRGGRGGAPRDDRHSHTGVGDSEKQAAHGWGGNNGQAEWADESAGDAIAKAEVNNDPGFTPDTGAADPAFSNGPDGIVGEEAAEVEPEEKTKSYDEYLKELAEKKLALSGEAPSIRKANEGSKNKFPEGQAVSREHEDFFIGGGGKTKKTKEVKEKERINLDGQYYAAPDAGDRGGRGGSRGGRGRGEGRGSFRGEGRGRGGRGRGDRGDFRGAPRGDRAPRGGSAFNANDSSAFPALGA